MSVCKSEASMAVVARIALATVIVLSPVSSRAQQEKPNSAAIDRVHTGAGDCHLYGSRNWKAWTIVAPGNNPGFQLNVSGQVDTPSPGYVISWTVGALDRRQPPSLRIRLLTRPPDGAALTVINPTDISMRLATSAQKYRAILVFCDDKLLAKIPHVGFFQ